MKATMYYRWRTWDTLARVLRWTAQSVWLLSAVFEERGLDVLGEPTMDEHESVSAGVKGT